MPKKCDDCGCEIPHNSYYSVCDSCRAKRETTREKEKFDKAKHYTLDTVPESSCEYMYMPGSKHEIFGSDDETMQAYVERILSFLE